jgi:hypothetical protein
MKRNRSEEEDQDVGSKSKKPKSDIRNWFGIIPDNQIEEDIEHIETINCLIYMYENTNQESDHYKKKYVGQTRQTHEQRDYQHKTTNKSEFDQEYMKNTSDYKLTVVKTKEFVKNVANTNDEIALYYEASQWMDEQEIIYVEKNDSFHNGFNNTKGGQFTPKNKSFYIANLKISENKWKTQRLRAFQAYFEIYQNANVPQSYVCPVTGIKLGQYVNTLRRGGFVPFKYRQKLKEMNFVWSEFRFQETLKKWNETYMPAFEAFYEEHKHVNVPSKDPVLGTLVNHLRYGDMSVPNDELRQKLVNMNFVWSDFRLQETIKKWNETYMPAFEEFYEEHKHVNVPRKHLVLGTLVHRLRTGHTNVPNDELHQKLVNMNLVWDFQLQETLKKWDETYMPAFEAFYKEHIHVEVPRKHPVLGNLVPHLRSGETSVPNDELRQKLEDMKFVWNSMSEARFERDYMPTLRIPGKVKFVSFLHVKTGKTTHLSRILYNIKRGLTSVPLQFREEIQKLLGITLG